MEINKRIKLMERFEEEKSVNEYFSVNPTVIKVVGVGNGGCNAVNRMIEEGLEGVSFIAINTDSQALYRSNAETRLVLGESVTGGLGSGTDPQKGMEAALADEKILEDMLSGSDLVFIASGFGGGTGTGASPVIAGIARKLGALTIGVVTKPFEMEGKLKMKRAEEGITKMLENVDSLIVIPNENLYSMFDQDIKFEDALKVVDDILRQGVQGISDIITQTGFGINVDFADVKTMIGISNGRAHLGIGVGNGEDRLEKAASHAFNNPLLDVENIRNAKGILANIVCPENFGLTEYKKATNIISKYAAEDANIKIGVCRKEDMHDEIRMTIVATGFEYGKKEDIAEIEESETEEEKDALPEKETENASNIFANTAKEKTFIEDDRYFNQTSKSIKQPQDKRKTEEDEDIAEAKQIVNSIKQTEIKRNIQTDEEYADYSTGRITNAKREERSFEEKIQRQIYQEPRAQEEEESSDGYVHMKLADKIAPEPKAPIKFDIVSEDELSIHTKLGEKKDYVFDESDLEVPAFLRRQIQTRK